MDFSIKSIFGRLPKMFCKVNYLRNLRFKAMNNKTVLFWVATPCNWYVVINFTEQPAGTIFMVFALGHSFPLLFLMFMLSFVDHVELEQCLIRCIFRGGLVYIDLQ